MNKVLRLPKINQTNLITLGLGVAVLAMVSNFVGMAQVGDIMMVLNKAGYDIPEWAADALTTVSGVYGVQHYLIGLLGVTIPAWLAGAVVAAGTAGL